MSEIASWRNGMRVRIVAHQGFDDMNGITGKVVRICKSNGCAWIEADSELPSGRNSFPRDDPHGRGRHTKVYMDECEEIKISLTEAARIARGDLKPSSVPIQFDGPELSAAPEGAPREGTVKSLWPKWCEEGDHPYFAISNGPTEYKCIICHLNEENDAQESALRVLTEERDRALQALHWSEIFLRCGLHPGRIENEKCPTCILIDLIRNRREGLAKHPAPATPRKDGQ